MALRYWITSLAVVAVTAAPAVAQDNNNNHHRRGDREQSQQQQSQPSSRQSQESPQSQQSRQTERSRREQSQPAADQPRQQNRAVARAVEPSRQNMQQQENVQRRADAQRRVEVQPRPDVQRRVDAPQRQDVQRRPDVQRREDVQRRVDVPRQNDQVHRDVAVPRAYVNRSDVHRWDGGHYGEPLHYRYGYYSPHIIRPTIIQVVPYRPYVYRPSWSIGVYYGYDNYYPYGYTPDGYFNPIPGRYYGGVRITGAPRDARVFADGYYVGIVDDFDGVFQHINLEAGPHHIEIQWGDSQPVAFDVNIRPGETITFRADPSMFQAY